MVSPANLHDSQGGVALLRASRRPWPFLACAVADRAYTGERVGQATCVKVVIERAFGWLARCRRLARDHEATPSSALAFLMRAAAMILLRRLAKHL